MGGDLEWGDRAGCGLASHSGRGQGAFRADAASLPLEISTPPIRGDGRVDRAEVSLSSHRKWVPFGTPCAARQFSLAGGCMGLCEKWPQLIGSLIAGVARGSAPVPEARWTAMLSCPSLIAHLIRAGGYGRIAARGPRRPVGRVSAKRDETHIIPKDEPSLARRSNIRA